MRHRLRQELLAAAPRLAAQLPYEEISIARLSALAGITVGDFRIAFGDVAAYIEALQQKFLSDIRARIIKVTAGAPPGLIRARLGAESYLAHCAENAGVRDWLQAARAQPAVLRGLIQQNQSFALVLGAELKALGRSHPEAVARLFIAMLNEVAATEQRRRCAEPALREALWHFLEHAGRQSALRATRASCG